MQATSSSRRVSLLPIRELTTNHDRNRNLEFPLAYSSRKKQRRWPLVLRFTKGSIHSEISFPVFAHSLFAGFVVFVNQQITRDFNLPSSIIPSLSIVVGLMLVFRNQTAYSRFWNGRLHLNTITTAVRCLSREIFVLVPAPDITPLVQNDSVPGMGTPRRWAYKNPGIGSTEPSLSRADYSRTVETIKILIAMLYTVKNHLRADWGVALSPGTSLTEDGQEATTDEYKDLLPPGLKGYEHKGLGLTLQLATFIEGFINLGVKKDWFHNAACSQMLTELNTLTKAYGNMEVIRLVPIPVAMLIHHKQTLALYCGILPFAMAAEMSWWAIPLVAFVSFTLYGIEAIAKTYEDPFGSAKIDINLDAAVADTRQEVEALLLAWQTQGVESGGMFRPQPPARFLHDESTTIAEETAAPPPVQVKFALNGLVGSGDGRIETEGLRVGPREELSDDASPGSGLTQTQNPFFEPYQDVLQDSTYLTPEDKTREGSKSSSGASPNLSLLVESQARPAAPNPGRRLTWASMTGKTK
ncbi:hypothetical protein PVAG01_04962 [Phlyctema vagabunda]|uniref:Uncharacterized protein n=1 Tax=Phlyctema vagabunda TaxID=108571 RepID=A0ABR4PIS8_9HELO